MGPVPDLEITSDTWKKIIDLAAPLAKTSSLVTLTSSLEIWTVVMKI